MFLSLSNENLLKISEHLKSYSLMPRLDTDSVLKYGEKYQVLSTVID